MGLSVESVQVPAEWRELDVEDLSGTIMVIGDSNSGKSTFTRWLVAHLCRFHDRVGWLDGDMGQTTLGVPTTLNLAVVSDWNGPLPKPDAAFFVGSTSPKRHMLPTLVGIQLLREQALVQGATAVVVDTTGLVAPEAGGGALKEWKIAMLRPTTIIALQRERELEHILAPLRRETRVALHSFPVVDAVRPRSPEGRAKRRRTLFLDYFSEALSKRIPIGDLPVYGLENLCPKRLVSFQDREDLSLALGVIRSVSAGVLEIFTPLRQTNEVASIRVGDLRLDPDSGEELIST
jgi:polynucleotide 5'-hydroxyl-kinase GRC3/NOL9